jgi:hypothetical protein
MSHFETFVFFYFFGDKPTEDRALKRSNLKFEAAALYSTAVCVSHSLSLVLSHSTVASRFTV